MRLSDLDNKDKLQHYFFQNSRIFSQGVFNPEEFLLIGFLLTVHNTPTQAGDALWGIINPNIEEEVS